MSSCSLQFLMYKRNDIAKKLKKKKNTTWVYIMGASGNVFLKNFTEKIDEIHALLIIEDVKMKYKIYISTINKP